MICKVYLKVLSWPVETLGVEGVGDDVILDQEIEGDKTVRDLLNRLATKYQQFGHIVFDVKSQKLTGRVLIFLNGRDLELVDGLETRLNNGDTFTFIPLIEGG